MTPIRTPLLGDGGVNHCLGDVSWKGDAARSAPSTRRWGEPRARAVAVLLDVVREVMPLEVPEGGGDIGLLGVGSCDWAGAGAGASEAFEGGPAETCVICAFPDFVAESNTFSSSWSVT